ncbi:Probable glutathione S-transferase MSR-1 [Linum grandiflorum]
MLSFPEIPVFFQDGKPPITESLIIVEYIDEIWGQSYLVLHEDPDDRAAARFWANFIDETRRRKWWRSSSASSWWSSLEQIMRDLTPPITNTKTAIRWKTKTEVLFVVLICFIIFSLYQFRSEISYASISIVPTVCSSGSERPVTTDFDLIREIEAEYIDMVSELVGKSVLPIGPLVPDDDDDNQKPDDEIIKWLNNKAPSFVVYISFFSESYLSRS